jgi:CSLREA domain-containing protein
MVRRNPAIHPAGFESVVQRGTVAGTRAVLRMRAMLAAAIFVAFALTLSTAVRAATTITVNSLADTGAAGICTLRDAITAVNTKTATNGCAAGTYKDAINFSVTGTIALASTLPQVTGFFLTINGPPSPGITINGGGKVQVMMVASGTTLNLNGLTIAGGGIYNNGTLTVINGTFSRNIAYTGGGGIYNAGTLTVINSTFARNRTFDLGGGIFDEARGG